MTFAVVFTAHPIKLIESLPSQRGVKIQRPHFSLSVQTDGVTGLMTEEIVVAHCAEKFPFRGNSVD